MYSRGLNSRAPHAEISKYSYRANMFWAGRRVPTLEDLLETTYGTDAAWKTRSFSCIINLIDRGSACGLLKKSRFFEEVGIAILDMEPLT